MESVKEGLADPSKIIAFRYKLEIATIPANSEIVEIEATLKPNNSLQSAFMVQKNGEFRFYLISTAFDTAEVYQSIINIGPQKAAKALINLTNVYKQCFLFLVEAENSEKKGAIGRIFYLDF